MKTGFVWHERYMWHDTRSADGLLPTRGVLEPGECFENPETKRRLKNLLDGYDVTPHLTPIEPYQASRETLLRFHTEDYVARIEAMSAALGGDAGEVAPFGPGSFEIARLAVGGVVAAADAVVDGTVDNAYALVRPPGHHAEPNRGRGFCIFSNVALSILDLLARKRVGRIAVVDWDVHHGNGTEQAFYDRDDVLMISLHEDGLYPADRGALGDSGRGTGEGFNINIPLPPGSGGGAYLTAFDRVVLPALHDFRPELIFVSCGFDAGSFDPLGHMMLLSNHFASMTERVRGAAESLCGGRLVLVHEGGYSTSHVPTCGLATIDGLRGERSTFVDPLVAPADTGWHALQPHQETVIDRVVEGPLALLRKKL